MRNAVVLLLVLAAGVALYLAVGPAGKKDQPGATGAGPQTQVAETPAQPKPPAAGPGDLTQPTRTPEQAAQPVSTAVEESSPILSSTSRENALVGTVYNEQGQPLEGAEVKLSLEPLGGEALGLQFLFSDKKPTGAHLRRSTDAKGQYAFKGIEPSPAYYLAASHRDYAPAQFDRVHVGDSGESVAPDFRLKKGSSLSGYVRAEDGGPISGARVHLDSPYVFDGSVKSPDRVSTTTDATGYYEIKNVPAGARSVTAEAEGFGTVTMMSSVPPFEGREGDNKTLDVMLSVAAPIGGLVVGPDGAPVPEARVIAMMFQNDKSSRGEALTDATGAFQIQGLAPGSYILQVEAKGFRMQRANRVSTGDLNVRLELVSKASVSGRVTDGAGPVTAFEVRALRTTPNPSPGAPQVYENTPVLESFTGKADGRFELRGFDPGSYALRVSAPGYAPTLSETFNVLADQAPPTLTIRLQKGGKIEGRVVDGEGAPVAGAKITSHDGAFSNSPADRIFQDLLASAVTQKSVVSSIDGYFTLDQLTPGTYLLEVTHARYTSELVPNLNVLEGQALKAGNVTLRAGGSVSGTVRDASGQAVVRGMVQLINTAQPSFSYEARTDAQGRYEFQHVKPGAYRLAATRNQATGDAFEQILDVQTSDVSIAVSEGVPVKRDLTVGN